MYSKQESFNDDTSDVEKDVNIKETQVTVQSVLDIAFNDKEVIQLDHSMPNNEANFEYAEEFETNSQDENNVLTDEITLFDNESEITKNLDGDDGLVDDELVDHQHKNSSSSKKKKTKRKYEMQDREVFINGETCGQLFTKLGSLKKHEMIHSGERPFGCKYCSKRFIRSDYLKIHERIHTGERPYKCKLCEKTFRQMDSLKKHANVHNNERLFECESCLKKFKSKQEVVQHRRNHSQELEFQCKNCKKKFRHRSNLYKHTKKCNKDQRVFCNNSQLYLKFDFSTFSIHP